MTRRVVVAAYLLLSIVGFGCSNDNSSSSGFLFTPSGTTPTARLVKLLQKQTHATTLVVQAVIYGPDTSLDMYSFAFDVTIGDTNVLQFAAGSAVAGGALVAFAGQDVAATAATDASHTTHVVVNVSKTGPPPGNGVAGSSAVIVELSFQPLNTGVTSIALTGSAGTPSQPPAAFDSADPPQTIGGIVFDSAAATVQVATLATN